MHVATFRVTSQLKKIAASMSNQEKGRLMDMHQSNVAAIKGSSLPEPDKARRIHVQIHAVLEGLFHSQPDLASEIKCKKGCSHCCHLEVGVTVGEAFLLLSKAVEVGHTIDTTLLETQHNASLAGAFQDLTLEQRRCIFLGEEGDCKVYDARPVSCRKYAVITDPSLCDTVNAKNSQVGLIFSLDAELMQSAAFNASHSGQMAGMLLELLPQPV